MQLLLMRHAEAKSVGVDGITSDEERELTEAGRTKAMEAAEGLLEYGLIKITRVYTSPLIRSVQTAEIVADVLNNSDMIISTQALRPGFSHKEIFELLRGHLINDRILLVAHQPDLGKLANSLLGGPPEEGMKLKAGDICAVTIDAIPPNQVGELDFLLTSKD